MVDLKFILTFLFIIYISAISAQPIKNHHIKENKKIQFYLSETGARDVAYEGDKIGYELIVYFDGRIKQFTNFCGREKKLLRSTRISSTIVEQLLALMTEYDFLTYPVEKYDPRRIIIPTSYYTIGFRPSINSDCKIFNVIGGAQINNYPLNHYEFKNKFRAVLFSAF